MNNQEIAKQTLKIIEQEKYRTPEGHTIDLSEDISYCLAHTVCYGPDQLSTIQRRISKRKISRVRKTDLKVRNETTLQGSRRLAREEHYEKIGVLNFASARNPGGGFMKGAQAQEESLARSSALYPSLRQCPEYYEYHRSHRSTLYSDRMIWSPGCPVLRTDDGTLLNKPYKVDFITSPAPNAGAVRQNEPENVSKIESVLRERSAKLLALAAHHDCEALILGAWGCGVFKNDPEVVARIFRDHLGQTGAFHNTFHKVLFSVLDTTDAQKIITPFRAAFNS